MSKVQYSSGDPNVRNNIFINSTADIIVFWRSLLDLFLPPSLSNFDYVSYLPAWGTATTFAYRCSHTLAHSRPARVGRFSQSPESV